MACVAPNLCRTKIRFYIFRWVANGGNRVNTLLRSARLLRASLPGGMHEHDSLFNPATSQCGCLISFCNLPSPTAKSCRFFQKSPHKSLCLFKRAVILRIFQTLGSAAACNSSALNGVETGAFGKARTE